MANVVAAQLRLVPPGVQGGVMSGNLIAFLISSSRSGHYVLFDAGTLLRGIRITQQQGALSAELPPVEFLNQHVKAIFLTHAHLDYHVGLVIASTEIKKCRYTVCRQP